MTRQTLARIVVLSLLAICLAYFLVTGPHNIEDVRQIGLHFRSMVARHPYRSPAIFVVVYVILAVLGLPVWWLQVLAGCGFGLFMGVLWTQIGATVAAPLTVPVSHWLAAEWYQRKIQSRLRKLSDRLNHNGLLVVMTVRLTHLAPFGLSNYAFGMIGIPVVEIALGTLLGNTLTATVYVTAGANPHLFKDWRYWAVLATANLLLLTPLILRYLRPHWFKKIGVK